MNGVISNERDRLDSRLRWLKRGLAVAGVFVVLGLVAEYGPEIAESVTKHRPPSRDAIGGLLITLGVFAEVVLGLFISSAAKRIQTLADSTIAEALERAATAGERAAQADERAANAEERTVKEQAARVAMLAELKSRDFTESQMNDFVEAVTGKLTTLNLFSLVGDQETFWYGATIAEGLRRAQVEVAWHPASDFPVGTSGLILYEHPRGTAGPLLMEAFMETGQSMIWYTPTEPLPNIPSPALFVGKRPPAFIDSPEHLKPP